jgi:hypothetical protein
LHIAGAPREICIDFLRGRCNRPNCRYLHSSDSKAGNKAVLGLAGEDSEQIHSDDEDYEADEQDLQNLQQPQQNSPQQQQEHEQVPQQHLQQEQQHQQQQHIPNQTPQTQQQSQQQQHNPQQLSEGVEQKSNNVEVSGIGQLEQRLLRRFTVDAAAQGMYKLF